MRFYTETNCNSIEAILKKGLEYEPNSLFLYLHLYTHIHAGAHTHTHTHTQACPYTYPHILFGNSSLRKTNDNYSPWALGRYNGTLLWQ